MGTPMSSYFARGRLMLFFAAGVAAAAVVTAAISSVPKRTTVGEQPVVVELPIAAIAQQLCLTERHLAIADLSSPMRVAVQAALSEHVQREWPVLQSLMRSRSLAARSPENGPTDLLTVQRSVAQWYEAARTAALTNVQGQQRQVLVQLYENRTSSLPLEFQVQSYTQAQVVALRDALSERNRRTSLGEPTDSTGSQLIAQYETVAVLTARQRLTAVP